MEKRYCEACEVELRPETAPDWLCYGCRAMEETRPTRTCYECDSPIQDSDRAGAVLCDCCLSMLMSLRSNFFTQATAEWEQENARRCALKRHLISPNAGEEEE